MMTLAGILGTANTSMIAALTTASVVAAINGFLTKNIPQANETAWTKYGDSWDGLQSPIKAGLDNAGKTLNWNEAGTPAYALFEEKDSFISELGQDEAVTKNLTITWKLKNEIKGDEVHY